GQVKLPAGGAGNAGRLEPLDRTDRLVAAGRLRPLVERAPAPVPREGGEGELVAQATREQRAAVPDARPAANELDPQRGQRVDVQRLAGGTADQLRRGQP